MAKDTKPPPATQTTRGAGGRKRRNKTIDASAEGVIIFVRALVECQKTEQFMRICRDRGLRIRVPFEIMDLAAELITDYEADPAARFVPAARALSSQVDDRCRS